MSGHTPEEIKKQVKGYMVVFVALLCLTVVTVALSYLDVSFAAALILALVVASIKGSLVCLYFMHLKSEKQIIYAILILTVVFLVAMMLLPLFMNNETIQVPYVS